MTVPLRVRRAGKGDGTLWKLNTVSTVIEQVAGIDSVAAPR